MAAREFTAAEWWHVDAEGVHVVERKHCHGPLWPPKPGELLYVAVYPWLRTRPLPWDAMLLYLRWRRSVGRGLPERVERRL